MAAVVMMVGSLHSAHAGRAILIDAGNPANVTPDQSNYSNSGQYWLLDNTDSPLTLFGTYIPLNFGSGAPASRRIVQDPRGRLVFVDGSGVATGDFIAPLLAPSAFGPAENISKSEGDVDRGILGPNPTASPYDYVNSLPAYRFTWNNVCLGNVSSCGGGGYTFQVILASLGVDSFLIDLNYASFNPSTLAGATAGISLGGVVRTYTGGFAGPGATYCFIGGVLGTYAGGTTCRVGPSAVPEPPTVALLFAAMAALVGLNLRRRVRTDHRSRSGRPALASPVMA